MTEFEERLEAYENLFVHDEELRFKATARRDRLLGLWAAEKMGYPQEKAQDYAEELVLFNLKEKGDEDIFLRLRQDFDALRIAQSDHQIRRRMQELMARALEEIREGR